MFATGSIRTKRHATTLKCSSKKLLRDLDVKMCRGCTAIIGDKRKEANNMEHQEFYVRLFTKLHESNKKYGIADEDIHGKEISRTHTDERPFCDDPECGCRTDMDLHLQHIGEPFLDGLQTVEECQYIYHNVHI